MAKVIAIDFGTSNTYLSVCTFDEGDWDNIRARLVPFAQDFKGIPTVFLQSGSDRYPAIPALPDVHGIVGVQAMNEFGLASDRQKREEALAFYSQFKPDLVNCPDKTMNAGSFQATVAFLSVILANFKESAVFNPKEDRVLFGKPCSASPQYCALLKEAAQAAGFGDNIELIDEPKGALYNTLRGGLHPIDRLMSGVLIVDFGGGTCDFAFLRDGEIEHSWGDNFYGGRLFDDLFYQWTCEQYPKKRASIESDGTDFLVRTFRCQKLKEDFSAYMKTMPNGEFSSTCVDELGPVMKLRWEDFCERGRHYSLSSSFRKQLSNNGTILPASYSAEIDLFEKFKGCLREGIDQHGIRAENIHLVILTGGSCAWSFVKQMCVEVLGVPEDSVFQDIEPYSSVAKGLSMFPAMQTAFVKIRKKISGDLPRFMKECESEFQTCLRQGNEELCKVMQQKLFVQKIVPILVEFRNSGGCLHLLKDEIGRAVSEFAGEMEPLAKEIYGRKLTGYFVAAWVRTRDWLKALGLNVSVPRENPNLNLENPAIPEVNPEIAESLLAVVTIAVATISGLITAAICGGAGFALLASGLPGWILGFLLGVAGAVAGVMGFGPKRIQEYMEQKIALPAFVLKHYFLTDKTLSSLRDKFYDDTLKEVSVLVEDLQKQTLPHVRTFVEDELRHLSPLNIKCSVDE